MTAPIPGMNKLATATQTATLKPIILNVLKE